MSCTNGTCSDEEKIKQLFEEKKALGILKPHQIAEAVYETMVQKYADNGYGCCYLNNPKVIDIIQKELHAHDRVEYRLYAYAIMPNHLHIALKMFDIPLFQFMQNLKGRTARACNLELKRSGTFWSRDYFEITVRNNRHFYYVINSILNNPKKAGGLGMAWKARYGASPWMTDEFTTQNGLEINKYGRGYIPHWETKDAPQFITIRLYDSVPKELLEKWRRIIAALKMLD